MRCEQEKRIVHGRRIGENERALAEIVQAQRRKHEQYPDRLNRCAAKMTHVRVKRLGPCYRKEDGAKHDETEEAVAKQKFQAMDRIEGEKDAWCIADMGRAQDPDHQKKNRHDGAEEGSDMRGSSPLRPKERHQNKDGDRQDIGRENRRHEFESLDGREDRNRWRDDRVARKQRRPRDTEKEDRHHGVAKRRLGECHQG